MTRMASETIGYATRAGVFYKVRESDVHAFMRGTGRTWIVKVCSVEEARTQYPTELAKAEDLDNNPDKYPEG
jgi:hypothetical protein